MKTNDLTQSIIPMTDFAFTSSAVKNTVFALQIKEKSDRLENINIRDLSLTRRFI